MADGGAETDVENVGQRGLSPLKIAAIYLVFGLGALLVFDFVVPRAIRSETLLHRVQTVKGLVEVALTAVLIYVLVARSQGSLTRTNRQLQEARTRLAVLYCLLRHNLRNELTLLRGFSERARDAAQGATVTESCEETIAVADEITHRVDKIHLFQNVVYQRSTPTDVPLASAVDRAIARVDARFDHDATISVANLDGVRVRAIPEIEHAIAEIVENAVVHAETDSPTVRIDAERRDGTVVLEIRDDGPGIPDHEAGLFEDRREETALEHASGVGLWLADWTAVESVGNLSIAEREDGPGTIVRMTLPTVGE